MIWVEQRVRPSVSELHPIESRFFFIKIVYFLEKEEGGRERINVREKHGLTASCMASTRTGPYNRDRCRLELVHRQCSTNLAPVARANSPFFKAKDMNSVFTKDIQMANKVSARKDAQCHSPLRNTN